MGGFVNTQGGGKRINTAANVNLTPPGVPVGYPNFGDGPMGINPVPNVIIGGGMVHNLSTKLASTYGDAPGSMGGVSSGTVGGQSWHTEGASHVLVGGAPVTRQSDPALGNGGNVSVVVVPPSQTIVYVA